MSAALLDTSFVLAFNLPSDRHHAAARRLADVQRQGVLTTECVLAEVLDAVSSPRHRRAASALVRMIRAYARVVPASTALLDDALSLYDSRSDKAWGITDCVSFVVMRREGIANALTADRHFEQAGFGALLRGG